MRGDYGRLAAGMDTRCLNEWHSSENRDMICRLAPSQCELVWTNATPCSIPDLNLCQPLCAKISIASYRQKCFSGVTCAFSKGD